MRWFVWCWVCCGNRGVAVFLVWFCLDLPGDGGAQLQRRLKFLPLPTAETPPTGSRVRTLARRIAKHPYTKRFVYTCILMNSLLLCCQFAGQPAGFSIIIGTTERV